MAVDVLRADDSAAIRKTLRRVLMRAEVPWGQVFEAGGGLQVLELLKTQSVNLVLSDIDMPNMDGIQLPGRIKAGAAWSDMPVIVITTGGSQATVTEAVQWGAAGYVRKPFTADRIKEKLVGLM